MLDAAKARAKRHGVPFSLERSDIIIPDVCPILGLPLKSNKGGGVFTPNSPTLDRICPKKGYVPGNVRVISFRANLLKSDATADEVRLILDDLEGRDACI